MISVWTNPIPSFKAWVTELSQVYFHWEIYGDFSLKIPDTEMPVYSEHNFLGAFFNVQSSKQQ